MKIRAIALALLFLAGCSHSTAVNPPAPPPANADHSITLSWTQSEANNGACSSTVTTSCLSGYTEGYLSGTTKVSLHTDTMAVCTGSNSAALACTSTFNGTLPIGSVTFYVVLNYADSNGNAQSLAAVTTATATQVAADAPTGLTAAVQP